MRREAGRQRAEIGRTPHPEADLPHLDEGILEAVQPARIAPAEAHDRFEAIGDDLPDRMA